MNINLIIGGLNNLSDGPYQLLNVPQLTGNTKIRGNGKTVLQTVQGPDGYGIHITGDGVEISGCIITNGGGVFIDKPGGSKNVGIVIDNNEFRINPGSGQYRNGISFTTGLQDSSITNNLFADIPSFGVYGYGYNNLTLANNEFQNCAAAAHIDSPGSAGQGNNNGLFAKENYITGTSGMGLEFQGNGNNVQVLDNWFEHPRLQTDASKNTGCMAFSIIMDKGSNILIQRNGVVAPERPDKLGARVGFELGGDNSLCSDNYINGIDITAADNDGEGTGSVTFKDNLLLNFLSSDYQAFPAPNRTYVHQNNGPNVKLTWDFNRPKPGRNKVVPVPNPTPVPTPAFTVTFNATTMTFGNITAGAEIWSALPISSAGREVGANVGPVLGGKVPATGNTLAVKIDGMHPGWDITFIVNVYKQDGTVLVTAVARYTLPGDPKTTPWPPTQPAPTVPTKEIDVIAIDGTKTVFVPAPIVPPVVATPSAKVS